MTKSEELIKKIKTLLDVYGAKIKIVDVVDDPFDAHGSTPYFSVPGEEDVLIPDDMIEFEIVEA